MRYTFAMRSVGVAVIAALVGCSGPSTVVRANTSAFMPSAIAVGGGFVYWVDYTNGNVGRAAIDGSRNTTLASGQPRPSSIAVDATNVYWTNSGVDAATNCGALPRCFSSNGGVFKMPLDGGTPVALASSLCGADSIAVDATNVYVGVSGNGSVLQIPIAGGGPLIHTVAEIGVGAVAVDAHDVYWTSLTTDWASVMVSKSPIDAPAPTVITPPLTAVSGSSGCGVSTPILAVDATNVYWSVVDVSQLASTGDEPLTLMKMPVAGGTPSALAALTRIEANGYTGGFTIDSQNAYWYDNIRFELRKVPLAGGAIVSLHPINDQQFDFLVVSQDTLFWADTYGNRISSIAAQ